MDVIQVGRATCKTFDLLRELGHTRKPILLKRGLSATIEEWLMSAEYILAGGNENVILCERGIRTFETYTRNTQDLRRHSGGEKVEPSAGHRGPQPCGGQMVDGRTAG